VCSHWAFCCIYVMHETLANCSHDRRLRFAGFGVAFLVRPSILERVDVKARSARATTELRAMYGGMELGLGAFFLVAALRPEWEQAALMAQVLGLGALAASRVGGIVRDRPRGALMKALAIAEGGTALLAGVALAKCGAGTNGSRL